METNYTPIDSKPPQRTRRAFLGSAALGIAALVLWPYRRHALASAANLAPASKGPVTIVPFSPDGKPGHPQSMPKVVKTDEEWHKQLSSNVLRHYRAAPTLKSPTAAS